MRRGKLQVKRIEDKNSRHVTFSKRRSGLIKKAQELSVLCDVDVAVFVFSGKGKLYQFSTGDSLRRILECCHMQKEAGVACGSAHQTEKIPERQMNCRDGTKLLQAVQRYLEEKKVDQLDVSQITQLEHRLDAILHQMRMKKSQLMMEAVTAVQEKEKQLGEGNQSMEQEAQIPAMVHEGQYQPQPSQEDNNPLVVEEEFYASADDNGNMPIHLQPFYML